MTLIEPTLVHWFKDRNCVVATFGEGFEDFNGEYHVRGGICWPRTVNAGGRYKLRGFICVGAMDINSKVTWVLGEHSFASVEPLIDDIGQINGEGVTNFVNKAWTALMCNRFYYRESQETARRFWLQLRRSDMIRDMPIFTDVYWDDDVEARSAIIESRDNGRLKIPQGGELDSALNTWRAQPDSLHVVPEIHALTCLVRGLQEYPHRIDYEEPTVVRVR